MTPPADRCSAARSCSYRINVLIVVYKWRFMVICWYSSGLGLTALRVLTGEQIFHIYHV